MIRYFVTALALVVALVVYPRLYNAVVDPGPQARGGVLDLRGHDWSTEPTVKLVGEWLLHGVEDSTTEPVVVRVPGLWNDVGLPGKPTGGLGAARYSLRVLTDFVPGTPPPRPGPLALMVEAGLPQAFTAHRGGGPSFLAGGRFSTDLAGVLPGYSTRWQTLPRHYRVGEPLRVDLAIANGHHRKGGLFDKAVLGAEPDLKRRYLRGLLSQAAILAVLMTFGLFNLGLFLTFREERAFLYFGLFCLAACGRLLVTDTAPLEPFTGPITSPFVQRLRYATLAVAFGTCALYLRSTFPEVISARGAAASALAGLALAVVYVVLPTYTGTQANILLHGLVFGLGVYYLPALASAAHRGLPDAPLACLCFAAFALVNVHDFARANGLIAGDYAQAYGLLALALGQGGILVRRFSRLSHDRTRLAATLQHANAELLRAREDLEVKVRDRTRALSERNARLAALQRFRERMATMLTHDLRSPLQVLLSHAATMPSHVEAAGRRMALMIDNLLDVSRAERAGLEVRAEPLLVGEMLSRSHQRLASLAAEHRVECVVEAPAGLEVVADRHLFERILDNVLQNAIKFSPGGGRVRLTAKPHPPSSPDGVDSIERVVILVVDEGPGFGQTDPHDAFTEFVSGEGDSAGHGVGLSFVALATEAMDAEVSARNVTGGGAEVALIFPAAQQQRIADAGITPDGWCPTRAYAQALAEIQPYRISEIRQVLAEIPESPAAARRWKEAVLEAAFAGDAIAYRSLVLGPRGHGAPTGEGGDTGERRGKPPAEKAATNDGERP